MDGRQILLATRSSWNTTIIFAYEKNTDLFRWDGPFHWEVVVAWADPEKVALKADPLSLVHDYRWLWQNDGGDRTAVDISLKADTWRSCKLSLPAASVSCRFTHPWPCLYAIPSNNPMDIIRLPQAICCSPSSLYTNDVVGRRKYQPNPLDCHFPRTWI